MADPSARPPSHDDDADTPDGEAWAERPSKTQLKKDMHELQALGEALVGLPEDRVTDLPIPESLRDAVAEYRRTRSHEGKRRQMQYIGKLMRKTDVEPIREAVASMHLGRAKDALALHEAERWRVELLADDQALTRWMSEHPASDLQQLRSLIRAARKDAAAVPEQRSGRAFRELFQFIKSESASHE
jgi:ribosome-associated protein